MFTLYQAFQATSLQTPIYSFIQQMQSNELSSRRIMIFITDIVSRNNKWRFKWLQYKEEIKPWATLPSSSGSHALFFVHLFWVLTCPAWKRQDCSHSKYITPSLNLFISKSSIMSNCFYFLLFWAISVSSLIPLAVFLLISPDTRWHGSENATLKQTKKTRHRHHWGRSAWWTRELRLWHSGHAQLSILNDN